MCFLDFFNIKGHAKLIDEHHLSRNQPYYRTAKHEKIVFHQPENNDPDTLVQKFSLTMIDPVSDFEYGIENNSM